MEHKEVFSRNLQKYMALNGKSRKEVCQALGYSYFTFSDWVNGKKMPRMDKVEQLANYFGITIDELMTATPVPHRSLPHITDLILTAVPLAMGVAVTVISLLGELDNRHAITMLGIGMCCLALRELCKREQHRH